MHRQTNKTLAIFAICLSLISISSCQNKSKTKNSDFEKESSINNLELKVEELEQIIKEKIPLNSETNLKTPSGKIKSLTFRLGTTDDRLRIYWEDGSKSDLPCTKEQFIWACG